MEHSFRCKAAVDRREQWQGVAAFNLWSKRLLGELSRPELEEKRIAAFSGLHARGKVEGEKVAII